MPVSGLEKPLDRPRGLRLDFGELAAQRSTDSHQRANFHEVICGLGLMAGDVLAIIVSGLVATLAASPLHAGEPAGAEHAWSASPEFAMIGGFVIIYMLAHGHYSRRLPFWTELREIVSISVFAMLATGFIGYLFHGGASGYSLIWPWILFAAVAVGLRRITKRVLMRAGLWQIRVLVIAERDDADEPDALLKSERLLGYEIVGLLTADEIPPVRGTRYFGSLLQIHGASRIILATRFGSEAGARFAKDIVRERISLCMISHLPGVPVFGFEQAAFFSHDAVMLSYRNNLAQPLARASKLAFDVIVASLILAVLSGPMLLIAILVGLDGGPVLFVHERVGLGGRAFRCLKFRTMVTNAEEMLQKILASDPEARAEWTRTHKLTNDPRITPIGRFLRATSLDELPQLFNVLRLEMSLVGPRPIVQQEVSRYDEDIAYYYDTKPGMTGLWQVSGRSDTTYRRRVELDSWYVRNWSMWHDVAIILKTIPTVVARSGAR